MNRINQCFENLNRRGEKALVCFLTAGDPSMVTTIDLVCEIASRGADIVEIGIPFSDPLADGPSIQAASLRALAHGATVRQVLDCVAGVRQRCDVPIVLMTYFNPVNHYGLQAFAKDAAEAGADGVIITDLPPDEAAEWKECADTTGLATVFLVAPTSTVERMRLAASMTTGFVYCVSRTGVTGAKAELPTDLMDLVSKVRSVTDRPIVIGFGISTAEHVSVVSGIADGAVVGSALVNVITESQSADEAVVKTGALVAQLKLPQLLS